MSWLAHLLGRKSKELTPAPEPRVLEVGGAHVFVTFDDGTVARYTVYGRWSEFSGTTWPFSGNILAQGFVDSCKPLELGDNEHRPRHRVVSYRTSPFAYAPREGIRAKRAVEYPWVEPVVVP